ncbi:hypothetical protein LTR36_001488 [Oleoguttula mirabilis]|uniref:Heterokaryon incompatibility domain-containing protein n=1 Tax=Oleoguttula mirabilis TaxID=1507867 RepID=A0AAV9JP37_9PEZI|nr:hypothetical protein LTR36_001488 [Oleoguttula mirabilis]
MVTEQALVAARTSPPRLEHAPSQHSCPVVGPKDPVRYTKLLEREIRLCTIERADSKGQLRCNLSVVKLDSLVAFRCLSYVWGSAIEKEMITLQGGACEVTPNLHAALRRLQRSNITIDIWIDAICINQADEVEKGQQVALMGSLFAKAEEVVVWLGEGADALKNGDSAGEESGHNLLEFSCVDKVLSMLAADQHFHDLPIAHDCRARSCAATTSHATKREEAWDKVLESMKSIFETTWFERAWTVQEIVLAQKARFLYGHSVDLPYEMASAAFVNLGHHMRSCCSECVFSLPPEDWRDLYRMARQMLDLANARTGVALGQHIVQSLMQFSWKNATDPRDKLYGLLGLQSGLTPTPVVPDYQISLQQLFCRFAADMVTTQGWLVPLCLDLAQELPDLPSWVPEWSRRSSDPVAYGIARFEWTHSYNAADGIFGLTTVGPWNVLSVEGLRFDIIAWVGPAYELTDLVEDQLNVFDEWKKLLDLPAKGEDSYSGGGALDEAFWRTALADRFQLDDGARPATPDDVAQLQRFLDDIRVRSRAQDPDAVIGQDDAMASHIIAVLDRRLFQTVHGWIGVCPKAADVGDDVFVLGDCPVPIVLRKAPPWCNKQLYIALGHCYLHGLMYGEALRMKLPRVRVHIK